MPVPKFIRMNKFLNVVNQLHYIKILYDRMVSQDQIYLIIIIFTLITKFKQMSLNDNGFIVQPLNYTSSHNYITQGAVVGITLGWFVGIVGFYVLGMLLIRYYFKRFPQQATSSSSSQPKQHQPSSQNNEPKNKAKSSRQIQLQQSNQQEQRKHKRKLYEQNPTMQMINSTQYQPENTYSKIKTSNTKRFAQINLRLEEKIQN